jgi:hypothetical protein
MNAFVHPTGQLALHKPIELAGQGPLPAAADLLVALALSPPAGHIPAGGRVLAEPSQGDHVQGPVELAISTTVETVAADPPRGGLQRRHPGQYGEGGLATHPPRMGPADQQLGGVPRSASSSSMSRYDSAKRRYHRTASTITSGGKQKPAKADRAIAAGRGWQVLMMRI